MVDLWMDNKMLKTILIISILYSSISYTQQEIVAIVISAEACGEREIGMYAVANTIQNRMILKEKTAYEIVTELHQYRGNTAQNRYKLFEECKDISLKLTSNIGKLEDITNGALYFKRPEEKRQIWHNILTVKIGNHEFYK